MIESAALPSQDEPLNHAAATSPLWLRDTTALGRLAAPLVANNLAISAMTFADTVMAGRLGALDLAAVGTGHSVWASVSLFGLGIAMALSPVTAQQYGAGDVSRAGQYVRQSCWIALCVALVLFFVMRNAHYVVAAIGVAPERLPKAAG